MDWKLFVSELRSTLKNCGISQQALARRAQGFQLPIFGNETNLSRMLSSDDPGAGFTPPARETLLGVFEIISELDNSGYFSIDRANRLLLARGIPALDASEQQRLLRGRAQPNSEVADRYDLTEMFGPAWARLPKPNARTSFRFVIISAPSGAGKDTLLRRIKDTDDTLHVLGKRATRQPWPNEPKYFQERTADDFALGVQEGRIIFPYTKRGVRYGFSASELVNHIGQGDCICAIFTEFDLVPLVVKNMNVLGLPTRAFFIQTPPDEMKKRNEQRGFDEDEQERRNASIDRDIIEIRKRRRFFEGQYTIIRYGPGNSNRAAVKKLAKYIDDFRKESLSFAELRQLANRIPQLPPTMPFEDSVPATA